MSKARLGGHLLGLAAATIAASRVLSPSDLLADLLDTPKPPRLKPSRGRGNQGDWVTPATRYAVSEEHQQHNAAIEAKRQAKLAARKARRRTQPTGRV